MPVAIAVLGSNLQAAVDHVLFATHLHANGPDLVLYNHWYDIHRGLQ